MRRTRWARTRRTMGRPGASVRLTTSTRVSAPGSGTPPSAPRVCRSARRGRRRGGGWRGLAARGARRRRDGRPGVDGATRAWRCRPRGYPLRTERSGDCGQVLVRVSRLHQQSPGDRRSCKSQRHQRSGVLHVSWTVTKNRFNRTCEVKSVLCPHLSTAKSSNSRSCWRSLRSPARSAR